MSADRESCELLRAIVRRSPDPAMEGVDQLAGKVRDWDSLLRLADRHRMTPMLFLRIEDMGKAVPLTVQERLRTEYQRNVFHSLANAAELIAVLKVFDQEMIPAMPFKGVVLAASVYHDLSMRPAGDLDILIHYRHLIRATTVLLKRGYELKTPVRADGTPEATDYFEYHFERQSDGMVIELRWRLELAQPRFRRNLGMDWVWPRRRTVMLAGAEVPDINPEIALLVLCMHASKHIWSRLIWLCDVAQLLAAKPDLDWSEVMLQAKRTGLWRTLALGVLLANRVAGAAVPAVILRRFESDKKAYNLALFISENLFDSPGSLPRGRVPYSIQLLGFQDRIQLLLSLDILRPNERDRSVVRLPKSLHGLYYLVRPFRILRDRSAR